MLTGEQVKAAMIAANIERVDHHACSFCGYMTNYTRSGETLVFDAGCDCGPGHHRSPRSWESVADWINMQDRPDVIKRLRESFGLPPESESP